MIRIRLARFLLRLGDFIKALPVVVMRPDDLIEFSRQTYAEPSDVESWAEQALVDSGLDKYELELLRDLPATTGKLLLLGVGGGREAIPLARMGFQVTGVDYVAAMVARAKENADQRGVKIDGLVQEISRLDVPINTYDVVWLSRAMYSSVPTRARRVEMVKRIARTLKPGGFFLCQFHWDPRRQPSSIDQFARRLVATITLGNQGFEAGDMLWGSIEFIHAFASEDAIRSELEEGGLSVIHIQTSLSSTGGNAICRNNI